MVTETDPLVENMHSIPDEKKKEQYLDIVKLSKEALPRFWSYENEIIANPEGPRILDAFGNTVFQSIHLNEIHAFLLGFQKARSGQFYGNA